MKFFLFFIIALGLLFSFDEKDNRDDRKLIQFSGIVVDSDSTSIVPFATIVNLNRKKAYTTNYKAYFSFVVRENDTILFDAIGYKKLRVIIPSNLENQRHTVVIKLAPETIDLLPVTVFPWASIEEFNEEFMALYEVDDATKNAAKNLSKEKLQEWIETLPLDAGEIAKRNQKKAAVRLTLPKFKSKGSSHPINNPLVWSKIIEKISIGDKKRSEK